MSFNGYLLAFTRFHLFLIGFTMFLLVSTKVSLNLVYPFFFKKDTKDSEEEEEEEDDDDDEKEEETVVKQMLTCNTQTPSTPPLSFVFGFFLVLFQLSLPTTSYSVRSASTQSR